jgi:hypothetical protein
VSSGFDGNQRTIESQKLDYQMERHRLRNAFLRELSRNNHFYVFVLALLFCVSAVWVATQSEDKEFIREYLKTVVPVITLYIGYAIGGDRKK